MRKKSSKKHGVNSLLNRSQSAMEYLMTYGWAILIIAIVLVALFSLGIFNSSNFAPRAQPGSCEVLRNSAQTSLVGQCNGMLPEYVEVTTGGSTNLTISNSQVANGYTISFWFLNNTKSSSCTHSLNAYFLNSWEMGMYIPQCFNFGPGSLAVYVLNNAGTNVGQNVLSAFTAWQNVIIVVNFTKNNVGIYRNGNLAFSIVPSSTMSPTSITKINNTGTMMYSNIQLYNISLSNSSIQALYKEGIGGAPINVNNLMGWWPLNGNANDYSGYGNDGTAANVTYTSSWTSGYSAP